MAILGAGALIPMDAAAQMTQPFLGEMRWVAFGFAPKGWATCNGQLLAIIQNQALFSLLGTQYGGNGQTTFALPNLQGRGPIHRSATHTIGSVGGEENHTLLVSEIPVHTHSLNADAKEGIDTAPSGRLLAKTSTGTSAYGSTAPGVFTGASITAAGGGQSHPNMKPYIALNCIIALQGVFPSQN